jgi:hypothetical protein
MLVEPIESVWTEVNESKMNPSAEAAIGWLLNSGIQQSNGGVARSLQR